MKLKEKIKSIRNGVQGTPKGIDYIYYIKKNIEKKHENSQKNIKTIKWYKRVRLKIIDK